LQRAKGPLVQKGGLDFRGAKILGGCYNPSVTADAVPPPFTIRGGFSVGKSYAINIEAEKLTFSIGEKLNDGRERFTFSNSCDMIKKKAVFLWMVSLSARKQTSGLFCSYCAEYSLLFCMSF
jgi:hypothetical protein